MSLMSYKKNHMILFYYLFILLGINLSIMILIGVLAYYNTVGTNKNSDYFRDFHQSQLLC